MRVFALLLFSLPCFAQYVAFGYNEGAPGTPIDSNTGGGCTGSSGAWTCTGAPTITLSDPHSLTQLYTTNGSTPSCPATGTSYAAPFVGPGTTFTLKAIGCNGVTGGGVLTSVYTISGGISFIQAKAVDSASASTLSSSFTTLPVINHTILVAACNYTGSGALSISDNQSNSYSQLGLDGPYAGYGQVSLWVANTTTSAGTFTVTIGSSVSNQISSVIAEYSGLTTTQDSTAGATHTNGTTVTSGSVTTTHASDLIITVACGGNGGTYSAGASNTLRASDGTPVNVPIALQDQIVSSTGTFAPQITVTGGGNQNAITVAVKAP